MNKKEDKNQKEKPSATFKGRGISLFLKLKVLIMKRETQ